MRSSVLVLLGLCFMTGCVAPPVRNSSVLEREFPFEVGEPVYLLKPSEFTLRDMMSVWMPRQPPPSKSAPAIMLNAIGPKDTTAPVLSRQDREALKTIATELPPYLPRRAIFLISSQGAVVEVALFRARGKLNERIFAARLRALTFEPATYLGKAAAVICEVDLLTGAVGPNSRSD